MIIRLAERELKTKYGNFREILYYNGQSESIALVMGDVEMRKYLLPDSFELHFGARF
jgi:hypothetical protein